MAQANIIFNLSSSGLGQLPLGLNYVRGLQLYGTAPGSFATTACQAVFSLADAESKGILNTYADETAATGTYLITTKGNTGDTILFSVVEPLPNSASQTVSLGVYTVASAASTIALQGAAWAAVINAGTYIHGYTAAFTTATLTVTARPGMGISLNSGIPIVITLTGVFAGTITQFSGGVYSKQAIWHYHISEYFRQNVNSKMWVQFTASASSPFTEVTALQNTANGECRSIGVLNPTARTAAQFASDMTALNTICTGLSTAYKWTTVVYAPNIAAITDCTTLVNLQTFTNANVLPCIAQDGNAVGANLYVRSGISISAIGNLLGTSSSAALSQNIGELGAFNITNGTEMAIPALSNGQLISSLSNAVLDQLDGYRYCFALNYTGIAGTFYSNDYTATIQTSDYNTLSRNLVIQSAQRDTYTGMLPLLKSRLYLNADGTLTTVTIEQFKTSIEPGLIALTTSGDLSTGMMTGGTLNKNAIVINPAQNVLSTNTVAVTIKLLPVGIADYIVVNIGFTPKLN